MYPAFTLPGGPVFGSDHRFGYHESRTLPTGHPKIPRLRNNMPFHRFFLNHFKNYIYNTTSDPQMRRNPPAGGCVFGVLVQIFLFPKTGFPFVFSEPVDGGEDGREEENGTLPSATGLIPATGMVRGAAATGMGA